MKFPVSFTEYLPRLITLSAMCFAPVVTADEASHADDDNVERIVVKGQLLRAANSAYSTANFSEDLIRELQVSEPQDILEQVPGVSIRDFGLSGVADAITVRGFSGGGHGGDLGVVLDGIPLNEAMSHADGYVDLDVIVPLEIASMDVFKGPVSALYGNFNRGGLINVRTRRGGDYRLLDVKGGSDSTFDLQGAFGAEQEDQRVNLAIQHFRSDGYRPSSQTERTTVAAAWQWALSEHTEMGLSGRWHEADGDNASYVPQAIYEQDPYGIDPNVKGDGADKSFLTLRADLNHTFNENLTLLGFAYRTDQDFTRWFSRPSGNTWKQREEAYERDVYGAGVNLNGKQHMGDTTFTWVAGVEAFQETTDFRYHDGLNNRQYTAPAINDRSVELDTTSAFLQVDAEFSRYFIPSIGLRQDWFDGQCTLNGPETGNDPCEELNSLSNLSPKVGVRSGVTDSVQLRASWAEGFALPNGWVKFQSQANNLDPVTFEQTEVGVNWRPSTTFELDVAYYQLMSSGEVRTIAPGEYENYGKTERDGIEVSLRWQPIESLALQAVYGTADAKVARHSDPSREGNKVGGVADYSSTVSAQWYFLDNWNTNLVWRSVGGFPINASNTHYSESYDVFDLTFNYDANGDMDWRAYLKIENLSDEVYAPSQYVIGGTPVYGTAAPRRIFVGAQIDF